MNKKELREKIKQTQLKVLRGARGADDLSDAVVELLIDEGVFRESKLYESKYEGLPVYK